MDNQYTWPLDVQHPEPNTNMHTDSGNRTSEHPNYIVMENHKELEGVDEMSTDYIYSEESYNRKTTIVDIYFSSKIAKNLVVDLEPKTIAKCMKHSD